MTTGSLAVGALLDLDVGAVAAGGSCVARHDGQVVFVRHALPGERVSARVTEVRSRYVRADAVTVLQAAPDRVDPPCPHAGPGRCGGCDWQHASLPTQRRLKATVVREQLARLAGVDLPVTVEPVPGDDDGLGWRTRVGYAVRRDGVVGLRRHRSHDIEPVEQCPLAAPRVQAVQVGRTRWRGAAAVEVLAGPGPGDTGDTTLVTVTPAGRRVVTPPLADEVGVLRRDDAGVHPVSGPTAVHLPAAGRTFRVSAGSFWQVHPGAADALVDAVLDFAAPREGERALDLYAGVGLFAATLAERVGPAGTVWAVEGDRVAARDAQHNLAGEPQVVVRRARVDERLAGWRGPADVVVLDPPRSGAGPTLCRALARLEARAVVYVACDPAALARDVAAFAAVGYRLEKLRAFDLFPMTHHVECVALLVPSGRSA